MESFDGKQPAERYYIGFDFTRELCCEDLRKEDVASASIVVLNNEGEDVTDAFLNSEHQMNIGRKAHFWVIGAIAGESYKLTCCVTGDGTPPSVFEKDAVMTVREL